MSRIVPNWQPISHRLLLGCSLAVASVSASPARRAKLPEATEPSKITPPAQSDEASSPKRASVDVSTLAFRGSQAFVSDVHGHPVCLTLHKELQQHALRQLRGANPKRGAIVLIHVPDGKVLAAAEHPTHTPKRESILWSALTPSASLFKLVTTAALVERAQIDPSHRVCSEGGDHGLSEQHLVAPKKGKIRCQSFSSILATSRNAAYARLVTRHLTSEDLSNFADRFGFNLDSAQTTPFEIGRYKPAVTPLGVARTATGFVGSSLSAFGAAQLSWVVANDGKRLPLQLFCDDHTEDTVSVTSEKDDLEQVMHPNTARRLRDMMEAVVSYGTAHDVFYDNDGHPILGRVGVAGKTGTLGHDEGTNSWFTGFAPSRAPEVVVAVLLDNGNPWRTTAKAVAAEVLRNYFQVQNQKE